MWKDPEEKQKAFDDVFDILVRQYYVLRSQMFAESTSANGSTGR